MNLKGRVAFFTNEEVMDRDYLDGDYEGQVVVLSEQHVRGFKPPFNCVENQLFYASGGFGCKSYTIGSAVFGTFLSDGERCRMERGNFIGILKPELVKEYEIDIEALKKGE